MVLILLECAGNRCRMHMAVSILYPSRRIVRIGHHGNFFVDKQKRKRKQKRNELTNVFRMFSDFWRRATRCRQKSKKMLNETVAFFPIFCGVLRTAAKNRKKCLMKPWHFFRFLAACYPKKFTRCPYKTWNKV